jgi:2-desacetyl-2-hydroxyethyl bacteriochlorophyllide A dehydrogenase
MRALSLSEPGRFDFVEIAEPGRPGAGQALVRILRIGVCGTDLHAYQGRQTFFTYPRVMGHELAVEVLETGPGVDCVEAGAVCSVEPFLNCGECPPCRLGRTNCCVTLKTLGVHIDGGMTARMLLPARKLHPNANLPLEQLAIVEPLCIGSHAFHRATPQPGDSILVIGGGPIGLAVVEAARAAGFEPMLMEVSRRRLEFAAGLRLATVDGAGDAEAQLRARLNGQLPRVIFDCTGSPRSMNHCVNLIGHGGEIVFVGHHPGEITFANPVFHGREVTLKASRNATAVDFQRVVGLLESGRLLAHKWLAAPVAPAKVVEDFPVWLDPENGIIKPVIDWTAA